MSRHLNRWIALLGWTVVMAFVWALFVPRGLSVGAFALLGMIGFLMVLLVSVLWRAQQPSTSVGQILADLEGPHPAPPVRR